MALAQATKSVKQLIRSTMQWMSFCQKLDEAIDDMENGRVQTVEEAWAEIDAV